jgi:hypothetical protein
MNLRVGDKVIKPQGYRFPSTVQSVFINRAGDTRVVCESLEIPGLLHIFSPTQVEKRWPF